MRVSDDGVPTEQVLWTGGIENFELVSFERESPFFGLFSIVGAYSVLPLLAEYQALVVETMVERAFS